MGYYVTLIGADFGIPEKNWDAAFAAVCELNEHDELKTGGSVNEKWFAWMDADYPTKALEEWQQRKLPHPLAWVFQELGFDWEIAPELHVEGDEFGLRGYDQKTGAEDDFLEAVAPFVRPGSYLEWRGEEGEMWRQEFDGEKLVTKEGRVVYD